ncbi:MAG: class I SAM-dependent methyltransferase [Bacteroidota bacterium]
MDLQKDFGNMDIYLFDQLLKGRIHKSHKILDAGCGGGRNSYFFVKEGFEIYGVDQNPLAIEGIREMASIIAPTYPHNRFQTAELSQLPYENEHFDWIICNAVLHFSENHEHFERMMVEMWRVLKRGGAFFARLASDIGFEGKFKDLGKGRYYLTDETERYVVTEKQLLTFGEKLGGELIERIKTTNVQNLRAMTTWVLQKY